uniref:Pentatricopeptide repeat-containing protein n=1 Tax=Rhizophora mucronata TaxID=61149 RepID=A0A2P2PJQ0_RHIMU
MLRDDIRPTEFTLSCILSSLSLLPVERGTLVHALVIKSGLELDAIVASTLVEMYFKFGLVDFAVEIFNKMVQRDLISWNTMIMGLADNGRVVETLDTFRELLEKGPLPDQITLVGVLLACQYGGLVEDALAIFSEMESSYGIKPSKEHYSRIIELLCQDGRPYEAVDIVEAMCYEPDSSILESVLCACAILGDFRLATRIAKSLVELEPQSSLSYLILAWMYEMRGQWGDVVRVKKTMEGKRVKKVIGCSLIGIRNTVYSFEANQLQHHGGRDIYFVLRLLNWEMEDEIDFCL